MDASELILEIGDGNILRSPCTADAQQIFETVARNYDHLRTFMEWVKVDYSLDDAKAWIDRTMGDPSAMNFLICRDEEMLGAIGFASFDHDAKVTEIGYWIDAAEEGKGITGRACRTLVNYAFTELGMERIQIRCADANVRSAAIPRRLGFTLEGRQRRHVLRDGKLYDFLIFGLLRGEWQQINP